MLFTLHGMLGDIIVFFFIGRKKDWRREERRGRKGRRVGSGQGREGGREEIREGEREGGRKDQQAQVDGVCSTSSP